MVDRIGSFGVAYSPTLSVMMEMVHHGHAFTESVVQRDVNSGLFVEIALQVPEGQVAHAIVDASAAKLAELTVYRLAGAVTGGQSLTPQNLNHNAPFSASVVARSGALTWSDGTVIETLLLAAGATAANSDHPGMMIQAGGWTVFRLTSLAANNDLGLRVRWYEAVR